MNLQLEKSAAWVGGCLGGTLCYHVETSNSPLVLLCAGVLGVVALLTSVAIYYHLTNQCSAILRNMLEAGYGEIFFSYFSEAVWFGLVSICCCAAGYWLNAPYSRCFLFCWGFFGSASIVANYRHLVICWKVAKYS